MPRKRPYDYDNYIPSSQTQASKPSVTPVAHISYEAGSDNTLSMVRKYISVKSVHDPAPSTSDFLRDNEAPDIEVDACGYDTKVYDSLSHHWMDPNDVDVVEEPAKRRRTVATV
ncbi:hypothetical protein C0992_005389 [Termitomyces sp. T32_za158]|nr:hypothetical protein C0992_005389 [Termitomyces sp. T32_za158]